jgi:hypothetical protein
MHKVLRKIRKSKENMKYSKERDVEKCEARIKIKGNKGK